MRIKFNDKIYRLKEIESGVDSLMELVEEQKYKDGDFVYEDGRIMIVKSYPNNYHANVLNMYSDSPDYDDTYGLDFSEPTFRYATDEEKQILIDAMKKDGKRWNAEKKCVEDIPKRKFKNGDKVTLKSGCTSNPGLTYYSLFDEYIGKELIVIDYTESGNVKCNNGLRFAEDWLEPWSDEPKVGDRVIAWDNRNTSIIGVLDKINKDDSIYPYQVGGINWNHAVKWDGTVDHLQKIRSGKV